MKNFRKAAFLSCIFFIPTISIAENIDIDRLMQSKADAAVQNKLNVCLANIPPKKNNSYSEMIRHLSATAACKVVNGNVPSVLTDISITASGANLQNLVISNVPSSIISIASLSIPNCSPVPISFSQTREVSASETASVVKKSTVTTEKSISMNNSAEVNLGVVKFGGGSSVSGKQIITNESGTTLEYRNEKKEVINLQTIIEPYKTLNVNVLAAKHLATVDYYGDVTLEAKVNTFGTYSHLVPDNKLSFNGSVYSNFVDKTTLSYTQIPLNPAACASVSTAKLQKIASNEFATKKVIAEAPVPIDLNTNYIPYGYNYAAPKQVTKSINNGLQITTANVIGSIQVRAKSTEVEPCEVSFFANEKQQKAILIPSAWSEWITLDTFSGTNTSFITVHNGCGGYVESEVRYFE